MNKKIILSLVLIFTLFMNGCIVINTGKDSSDEVKSNSQSSSPSNTEKETTIANSNNSDDNSNDTDTNNSSNSNDSSSNYTFSSSSAYSVPGYIFYDSDTRYLTFDDIRILSPWEIKLARNEIFARHGRLFNTPSLQDYFNSCSWYNGYISPKDFDDNCLNEVELYNIKLIKQYE